MKLYNEIMALHSIKREINDELEEVRKFTDGGLEYLGEMDVEYEDMPTSVTKPLMVNLGLQRSLEGRLESVEGKIKKANTAYYMDTKQLPIQLNTIRNLSPNEVITFVWIMSNDGRIELSRMETELSRSQRELKKDLKTLNELDFIGYLTKNGKLKDGNVVRYTKQTKAKMNRDKYKKRYYDFTLIHMKSNHLTAPVKPATKVVLAYIETSVMNPDNWTNVVTDEMIAKMTGYSLSTVKRSVKELVDKELIIRKTKFDIRRFVLI